MNQKFINMVLPYRVIKNDEHDYRFVSESGNQYHIYFDTYWQQDVVQGYLGIAVKVFEFYFEVDKLVKVSMDYRIAITIFSVLEEYMLMNDTVVYYVTQRIDGRAKQLFKVYQLWFNTYLKMRKTMSDKIIKIDRIVESYGFIDAYVSCLLHYDCFTNVHLADLIMDKTLLEVFPNSTVSKI